MKKSVEVTMRRRGGAGAVDVVVRRDVEVEIYSCEPRSPEAQAWSEEQTGFKGSFDTNAQSAAEYAQLARQAGFSVIESL